MRFRKYLPRKLKLKIAYIHYKIYERKMPWSQLRFEVHLTDKCNLNCAGCLHFSSLCDEIILLDIKDYENDCKRISELTGGKIADIRLLGGEPLLHSDVNSFLTITRKYFPEREGLKQTGIIELVTNGILLSGQPDDFWESCKTNNIRIVVSEYPVKIKREIIKERALWFNVELRMYEDGIQFRQTGSANQWVKIPVDTGGVQDNKKSFGKCILAGSCFQLVNGKIFKCARIAYIKYFNSAFNEKLKTDEKDYVDIYKAEDINEILFKLTEPATFCRYCKAGNIMWDNKWKMTGKIMGEYI
jgi:hypothetical protein